MAVVLGSHPPAVGDPVTSWGGGAAYDANMPSEYQRFEVPLLGTNQAGAGVLPVESALEWPIRGITVINSSTKGFEFKWGYETALGDLNTEADYIVDPYKMVNLPCYKQRIYQITYAIIGPQATEPGSIEIILVPIYLPASSYDIQPATGASNSWEIHANAAFATAGDTGAVAFADNITSVTLCADAQNMNFYIGRDVNTMTGPLVVLAGEKFSLSGTIGAYRVTNTSGATGGYRVIGMYNQ